MNLTRLRVLQEVARLRTLAAAADALSFTPSAVSQQMARLEAEVGATLMERTPRGVRLTEAGDALLARATAILELVRDQHALPDHHSVRALVAAGEGVALLPRMAAALPYPGTTTTALHEGAPAREILVARPAGGLLSTPASAMRELLVRLAAEVEAGVPAAA